MYSWVMMIASIRTMRTIMVTYQSLVDDSLMTVKCNTYDMYVTHNRSIPTLMGWMVMQQLWMARWKTAMMDRMGGDQAPTMMQS